MEWPEVGVRGRGSRFSMAYTSQHGGRIRLRIDTSRAVPAPSVRFGGIAMTCTDSGRHRAPAEQHDYEIINPPVGVHAVTGTFAEDVHYQVRLVDDSWASLT